jgi:hypothetical protein
VGKKLDRRLWTAALTGIPFGIYKMGFGWYEYHHAHPAIGIAALIWGALDIILNILSVAFPKTVSWCLLANIGRRIDHAAKKKIWEKILLAVDTTAAFLIVSAMIWLGRLPLEPEVVGHTWNLAVVANILSVGLEQLYRAVFYKEKIH